jgi:acyl-CoA thioester hydrolase
MTRRRRHPDRSDPATPAASVAGRVAFHDVDAMRIVWHGNYLKYFEIARDRLFAQHGIDMYSAGDANGPQVVYPVIRTATRHSHPLRYGDEFVCTAILAEARTKLIIDYQLELKEGGALCATGRTEQVALRLPELELQLELPASLRRAFGREA